MSQSKRAVRGLTLRGNVWWLQFTPFSGGRRQRISLETSELSEAIEAAEKIRQNPSLVPSDAMTEEIERFIAWKLRMRQYTAHTARTKRGKLLLMKAALPPHATAASVSSRQIQAWHDSLLPTVTATTITGYMMAARAFFRWSVEIAKTRRTNPVDEVRIVKTTGKARQDFCTIAQRDSLIAECQDEELKFILFCGFHAGLRFNEISEARPFWFDVTGRRIVLRKTSTMNFKDGEERTIPMSAAFADFLTSYGMREPYMLAPDARKDKWLYRYDFRSKFMRYVKSKGMGWVTPHIMRHTFASVLVSAGESIYRVAVWMGDEVGTVQKHYGHLAPDDGSFERFLNGKKAV